MDIQFKFPVKPYKIQLQYAHTIIQSLNKSLKLCLMESPTGTGKSYSLLVSLMAWLQSKISAWFKKKSNSEQEDYILQEKKRIENRKKNISETNINEINNRKHIKIKKQKQGDTNLEFSQISSDSQESNSDNQINNNAKRKILQIAIKQEESSFNLPKIIYTSRTHTQLSQIVKSFKKIKSQLVCISLASKKNLCIHDNIKKTINIESNCSKLLQKSKCQYYLKKSFKQFENIDIQECFKIGDQYGICPYYSLKSLLDIADIICVPYSSILNKNIRHKLGINIKNSLLIFDQGHNIIQYNINSQSKQIKYKDLCDISSKIEEYINKYNKMKIKNKYNASKLLKLLKQLMSLIKFKYQSKGKLDYSKQSIMDFLLELNQKQIQIHKIKKFIEQSHFINRIYNDQNEQQSSGTILNTFVQFFQTIIFNQSPHNIIIFKYSQILNQSSVKIMCFEPTSLKQLIQLSKITIITGGTLYPLNQFKQLVQNKQYVQREYEHIIGIQNCQVYIIQEFKKNTLIYNFEQKQKDLNIQAISEMVKKSLSKTNEGIIIFVQNYKYIDLIKEKLKYQKFYSICLFDSKNSNNLFQIYQKNIKSNNQNILFTVMGAKLSQGINFSDSLARILLIFGLPYPNHKNPEIIQKMDFYNRQYKLTGQGITGNQFYQNLCMKVVNQTIGRAIRHQHDHATIYLVDERYSSKIDKLSKWLRPRCHKIKNLQQI